MFRLRPTHAWFNQKPVRSEGRPVAGADSRFAALRGLFLGGLRQRPQPLSGRRASDSLGPAAAASALAVPAALNWNSLLGGPSRSIQVNFGPDWLSPVEEGQLLELKGGADVMITELVETDLHLAALHAQVQQAGQCPAGLAQEAHHAFAHVDQQMQRWGLRAEEIERNQQQPDRLVAPAGPTPSLFASPVRFLRHWWTHSPLLAPLRPPASPRDQRRQSMRDDLQRLAMPTVRQRQHELRVKAQQAAKFDTLRAQINSLGQQRAPLPLKVTLARMASLRENITHLAHELHHHREDTENRVEQRLERRRAPRAPGAHYPAPTLKPKRKDETV